MVVGKRHKSGGESPDFETLKLKEAAHISKEFYTEVADEALNIISTNDDPEFQYYQLVALAQRHAEPLYISDIDDTPRSYMLSKFQTLMAHVDHVVEFAAPHLLTVPPETIVGVGFTALFGTAFVARNVMGNSPVALTGFMGFSGMFTSFSRQLLRQNRA